MLVNSKLVYICTHINKLGLQALIKSGERVGYVSLNNQMGFCSYESSLDWV